MICCVECGLIFDRSLDGDAFGAPSVQLPCLVDSSGREYQLRPGANVLGRLGDIEIDDTRISRKHAQLTLDGMIGTISDLGSTNGTKVNGTKLEASASVALAAGDTISLGGFELSLSIPGESMKTMVGVSSKTAAIQAAPTVNTAEAYLVGSDGTRFPLNPGVNTFGRRDSNAIKLTDPYVSGQHGQIEVTEEGIFLTDLGSTNGTLLNDAKLGAQQRIQITPDDTIRLGENTYNVVPK